MGKSQYYLHEERLRSVLKLIIIPYYVITNCYLRHNAFSITAYISNSHPSPAVNST